ncbi:putative Pentatricopeptide repeat-containing protein [Hibiscus syriacus]|uniref:Pentatricopeptide repeat-containing protein n=1 Tax=Hibiscus syriacus TaxID=106335 RepID=A0A6A2WNG3_HIBSY|nr:uncharacterized protein LOC120186927 [Hibiscus syriacus]KAE8661983.1 putative Pentatricopeptide repeat-containing protein [Hibiscus syriacus]
MAVLFLITFRDHALLLQLLLLVLVPLSSSSSFRPQHPFSAIRLPSEANPCARSTRPNSCPVNCFMADPVCGDNGVTYWCGCADAYCAGVKVAKIGFCEAGNSGGSGGEVSFPGQALLLVHIVWLILLGFAVFLDLM